MAYCRECGSELDTDAKFCTECGSGITDVPGDTSPSPEQDEAHISAHPHPGEDGLAPGHLGISAVAAVVPAFILALIVPVPSVKIIGLLGGLVLFAYLGYQRPTAKAAIGRQSFWSAIMLFVSPVMMIIYTLVFTAQQTDGTAEEAGAALGGTVLILLAFVVGLPLGIGFYLLSRRWDVTED